MSNEIGIMLKEALENLYAQASRQGKACANIRLKFDPEDLTKVELVADLVEMSHVT